MNASTQSLRLILIVYVVLIGLLALSAGATFLPGGWWSTPISMTIALAKASLIFFYFMRLRSQSGLVRVFALAGFFWLAILVVLTLADYLTRAWPV
jgi:cytochrome c oxidase subunit 4